MIQDKAIVTIECEQELVCDLSNGAMSVTLNDYWPRFQGHAII